MRPPADAFFDKFKLDQFRSSIDFLNVVEEVRGQICNSEKLRSQCRVQKGLSKKFSEEIVPLALLIKRKFGYRLDICCKPNFDPNGEYDAELSFKSGGPNLFLEFTQAMNGKEDFLRMQFLNAHGHVNLFGPIFKDEEDLAEKAVAMGGSGLRRQQTGLIMQCLDNKLAKRYPGNCLLVIVFDDTLFDESELQRLQAEVHAKLIKTQSSFAGIILLGCSNATLVEIRLCEVPRL